MKITTKQPKKGQFVAVWKTTEGLTCSAMFEKSGDQWKEFKEDTDDFEDVNINDFFGIDENTIYIKL